MTEGLIILILAILGVCFGSFVNAAVWRIKVRKDIVHDRSECVHCHHKLSGADLVPLFSWIALRGKCRYCKKPISVQYPLVELAVMLYFVLSYLVWPFELNSVHAMIDFVLWLVYGVGLAILFVYDFRWYLLPDRVVWPLIALGAINFINMAVWRGWTLGQFVIELGLAPAVVAGLYYVLHMVSKGKWVGFGDVKLGIFMGLALGWQLAFAALILANLIGCLIVIPGLATGALKRDSRIPFGPLLITGFIIAGLTSDALINWCLNLFSIPIL